MKIRSIFIEVAGTVFQLLKKTLMLNRLFWFFFFNWCDFLHRERN